MERMGRPGNGAKQPLLTNYPDPLGKPAKVQYSKLGENPHMDGLLISRLVRHCRAWNDLHLPRR